MAERDPALRRFERDMIAAWGVTSVAALVLGRGRVEPVLGVLTGGLLSVVSYRGLKGGVDALLDPGPRRLRRVAWHVVKYAGRFALLAVAAYVMLTRFRAHPVGVLAGVSAPFLAAVVALARFWRQRARPR